MTAVVGVLCKNGVVIGTDSSTTFVAGQSFRTIELCTEKLGVIADKIIVAGTGEVGLGQRFCAIVEDAWKKKWFTRPAMEVAINLSKATVENFQATYVKTGNYGALVAFPADKKIHLCEFSVSTFQPEFKTDRLAFCSMGSTQPITDPFLAFIRGIFWPDAIPSIQDAVFAVTWTLDHAIEVNPGGVNGPPQIAVLESEQKVRLLDENELDEHRQNIQGAKERLREWQQSLSVTEQEEVPEVPQL